LRAQCHADIACNFRKTGMARSFYRLTPQNVVEDFKSRMPFYHEASDSYFGMLERSGKYYQRRWQRGFDGKETNVRALERRSRWARAVTKPGSIWRTPGFAPRRTGSAPPKPLFRKL